MLLNGSFAAPAADAARTDEFGIFVNCAERRFGHDRVVARIKNPCQADLHFLSNLHFFDHVHLSCPSPTGFHGASTQWFFLRPPRCNVDRPASCSCAGASWSYGVDRKRDLIRDFLQNTSITGRKLILSRAKDAHNPDAIPADDQGNRADGPVSLMNGECIGGESEFPYPDRDE